MLLAIDAGNSTICFAVFENETLCASWRAATDLEKTADEWGAWLTQVMRAEGLEVDAVQHAIISSVVPEGLATLKDLCTSAFKMPPLVVGEAPLALDLLVSTDTPAEVGADLVVGALAGKALYGGPLLIVDSGTATTVSLVDAKGAFAGVAIAPGVTLSLHALYMAAAQLPQITLEVPEKVIGTNTPDSMQGGVFWGYISMIEGLITRAQVEFVEKTGETAPKVLATGGNLALLKGITDKIDYYEDTLIMKGLALAFKQHQAQQMTTHHVVGS